MFLMCPLTLTSPSLYLLLIGHPWWLSHLVLKTVGCILSAQDPLGGYSSSSKLVLGGQGQSLCLSPCLSTLHTSLEFLLHLPCNREAESHCWAGMLEQDSGDALALNSERRKLSFKEIFNYVKYPFSDFIICMLLFVFIFSIYSCKVVNLVLFRYKVSAVASKSTIYLLCIALLLLPAHVCLGFWDRSLGLTDHTWGEHELSTQTSTFMTKKNKEKNHRKTRNCGLQ